MKKLFTLRAHVVLLLLLTGSSVAFAGYVSYSRARAYATIAAAGTVYVSPSPNTQGSSATATHSSDDEGLDDYDIHPYCFTAVPTTTSPGAGYAFDGWWEGATSGNRKSTSLQYNESIEATSADSEDPTELIRYARWHANTFTITLNNQSATTAGTASVTATYNEYTNLTSAISKPTKSKNVFNGYYTAGGTQLIGSDGYFIASKSDASYTYTDASKKWKYAGNIELFAQWVDAPMASVTAAPTPIQGLTFTGNAQTLINAGTAGGGTMQYSLDGSSWSASLPTATNWGTYTVYYRVAADDNHTDNPGGTITAIIGKAPSYGLTVGPWTFDDVRTGWTGYEGAGTYISFNGLNDSKWSGNTYRYNDYDGCGYAFLGNNTANSKYAIFSTYKHTETVPSYTRKTLVWNYQLTSWSSWLVQTTALYAADNLAYLKTLPVDFTERYTDGSGSFYHLAHLTQTSAWYAETSALTGWFGFDNRSGSTSADITDALLLTQVIGDGYNASIFVHNWGSIKDAGSSWLTYYYKYITYDPNGGTGSMSVQEIENSSTLTANAFTREGYVFAGWKDANGTFYRNNASITATESDKGSVTLYAQWISQDEIDLYVGKVIGADGKLYKTVAAATNAGTTASGVVAYWGVTGSIEDCNSDYRGLAISTGDVATFIPWCTDPSGWFAGSTLAQALDARNGWERTNSFGRPSSRDIEDQFGHHHSHQAAAAAYDYNVSRPTGASPWFVPTMGQWNLVAQGLTGSTTDISETQNPEISFYNLATKLHAAGANQLTWCVYWSSTEVDGTNMWTFCVEGNGSEALSVSKSLDAAEFVRTCFAFESAVPAVYTISYDANGGEGAPASQTKDGGIDLTLSSTVPTREGYTFAGWATTPDGDVAYADGDTYTGNADQTLYAQWSADTHPVTANADPEHQDVYYSTFYYQTLRHALPNDGTEAYVAELSGTDLLMHKIAEGAQVIPEDVAVILKSPNSALSLTVTDAEPVMVTDPNCLLGTDEAMSAPADCYVISGHSTDEDGDGYYDVIGVGFYQFNGTLKAHKAYTIYDSGGGIHTPRRMRFIFNQEQVATDLDPVTGKPSSVTHKVIEDGQLIIIRNGVRYNAMGQIIK